MTTQSEFKINFLKTLHITIRLSGKNDNAESDSDSVRMTLWSQEDNIFQKKLCGGNDTAESESKTLQVSGCSYMNNDVKIYSSIDNSYIGRTVQGRAPLGLLTLWL